MRVERYTIVLEGLIKTKTIYIFLKENLFWVPTYAVQRNW